MRFSGDTDVAGPVQSAGILTPLVPLLGTAKRKEREGGAGGQAVGGKLHAVTSRRIGLLYSCQVGVKVTSISHFI